MRFAIILCYNPLGVSFFWVILAMSTALRSLAANIIVDGEVDDEIDTLMRIPPDIHTLTGFRKWALSDDGPEKLPVMFLSGEVYIDMSKEEIRTHAAVNSEVS